jgi:hypothetical protein
MTPLVSFPDRNREESTWAVKLSTISPRRRIARPFPPRGAKRTGAAHALGARAARQGVGSRAIIRSGPRPWQGGAARIWPGVRPAARGDSPGTPPLDATIQRCRIHPRVQDASGPRKG